LGQKWNELGDGGDVLGKQTGPILIHPSQSKAKQCIAINPASVSLESKLHPDIFKLFDTEGHVNDGNGKW
jgi:hypothetical protein